MLVSARVTGQRVVRAVAIAAAVALLAPAPTIPAVGAGRAAASGEVYADFSTQPLGAGVGVPVATGDADVPWAIQPVVSLYGDWDPALAYQADLRIDPSSPDVGGPGRLTCAGGTSMAMVGGVAAFRGCRIDTAGRAYRLAAYVTPYDPSQGPAQGRRPPACRSTSVAARGWPPGSASRPSRWERTSAASGHRGPPVAPGRSSRWSRCSTGGGT